jgi:hypothetical protein
VRYYDIQITNSGGSMVRRYTSFVNGKSDPGALHVELNIPVSTLAAPRGDAFVQIWGIPLADIAQASDLNGMQVAVYGGMQKGLPLANPSQAGLLVKGYIFQAFGNWLGVDMTLDLVIRAAAPPPASSTSSAAPTPRNLVLNTKAGSSFSDAIKNTLTTAYPGFTVNVNVSANLVRSSDTVGFYSETTSFARYIKEATRAILGGNYAGVDIAIADKTISVYDSVSTQNNPTQIAFQDLIGQPTWIEAAQITFKCVMRADIRLGSFVKMPPTLVTNTAQAQSSISNQKAAFQGSFFVSSVQHFGAFRQPDAASWVTVFVAAAANQQQA